MKNYVEVAYNAAEKPFGEYPLQLAGYLVDRYGFQKDMKLLDVGCGRGEYIHAFTAHGLHAFGADVSNYCKEAVVVDLNAERLPFEDETFDVVFSKSVIEHIEKTEHYMSEMRRVLKTGGRIILLAPDWETQYLIFYQDPTHIHPYTVRSFDRLLHMFEYKYIHTEKFTQLPSVWRGGFARAASRCLRLLGPVKKVYKNKFYRFSRELMVLGEGVK